MLLNIKSIKIIQMNNWRIIFNHKNLINKFCVNKFSVSSSVRHLSEKTALYNLHIKYNGKMVNFFNYNLPMQYDNLSINESTIHTRKYGSLFDVSHMLQTYIRGKDAIECIESICTADIKNLKDGQCTLTVFTNKNGGILDDLIITKINNNLLYIVSNANCKINDKELIEKTINKYRRLGKLIDYNFLNTEQQTLIALQGPNAKLIIEKLTKINLNKFFFMNSIVINICGVNNCRLTRCGYTGEDGFELSIPNERATEIVETILNDKEFNIKLAGLGARDALRIEAGLCLYGVDIDDKVTPVEAGLSWLIAKRRKNEGNFPGAKIIMEQLMNGCTRSRVGINLIPGPIPRHGNNIINDKNEIIGYITSGCRSPNLKNNIAIGYISTAYKKPETLIRINIRERFINGNITKLPFIKCNYYLNK